MQLIQQPQLDFSQVMMKPKRSSLTSRADVSLVREFRGRWNPDKLITGVPIVAANMDNIATIDMAKALSEYEMMTAMSKFTTLDDWDKIYCSAIHDSLVFPTIGIRSVDEYEQYKVMQKVHSLSAETLLIDVPNGYTERFLEFVSKIRKENPKIFMIAGNVVSAEQVEELITRGADCVKVGIGSGSACLTRIKSGVGRPQFTTVVECADAAHGLGGYIMSDGGCTNPGDIAKAFGGGADFVMLGGMFAGHDECDGEIVSKYNVSHSTLEDAKYNSVQSFVDGVSGLLPQSDEEEQWYNINPRPYYEPVYEEKKFKQFWGMSSTKAMEKHYGKQDDYKASEGREVLVPYRGPVINTIQDILGGVRSACTYIGARKIKDMPKCATFYTVSQQVNNPYDK